MKGVEDIAKIFFCYFGSTLSSQRDFIFRSVGLLSWNLDTGSRFSDQSSANSLGDVKCWGCLEGKVLNGLEVSLGYASCALV